VIHGWFGVQGRPYVFAAVTLPRLGFTRRVRLLVDTSETTGIGGISEYYREPALVTFRDHEESNLQVYRMFIDIARPTQYNDSVPSLLGQDILRNWRVIHDRFANELTFEVHLADFRAPA
jgi:hypothetical protein